MADFLAIMVGPFLACLILTGIQSYLGIHILRRGVIFVDLALAQIAAFGATIGFILGFGLHSTGSYFASLACTLVGAVLFSWSRSKNTEVPQEAYIGILYAIASAATILALAQAPEGGEELKTLLVGHLLFVDWSEIVYLFVLYGIVGIFHWHFRERFFRISRDPSLALEQGISVRWWDFCFYASLGLVVTSSTEVAGVLLVFSFLVVPAVCGCLMARTLMSRLLVGWLVGMITSVVGMAFSYSFDLPTGATVVCVFGLCLLSCIGISHARGLVNVT